MPDTRERVVTYPAGGEPILWIRCPRCGELRKSTDYYGYRRAPLQCKRCRTAKQRNDTATKPHVRERQIRKAKRRRDEEKRRKANPPLQLTVTEREPKKSRVVRARPRRRPAVRYLGQWYFDAEWAA
jgi:hypothetical protein